MINTGTGGPTLDDGSVVPFGGTQIGGSKYWIGDYTIEPENGGVGVFAHEFGHDLDLPDLYNTSGGGAASENSTAFWTLMSSGSWLGEGTEDIGSKPGHMGNWEKFQLGWLNYEVAFAGQKSEHKLGPAETNNNTRVHPGEGLILPIDAHPQNMIRADGGDWRGRIQAYDSTFGFDPTDALELHWNSQPSYHASQPAVPVFDDNIQYWNSETPVLGVINPNTGTQIRIKSISAQGGFMQVEVRPSK